MPINQVDVICAHDVAYEFSMIIGLSRLTVRETDEPYLHSKLELPMLCLYIVRQLELNVP